MNAPGDSPAVITLREVYDIVQEMRQEVALLKTTELTKDVDDHETRLRSLEKWVWRAGGIAAAIGAAGGAVVSQVFTALGG
ncbi:hypothetical protein [Microbacterium hydrocarbonoxydans]|uniref:hypothetical protein n=1 Tax=Microbacterium hydrocarbonoxydans TaxID=273678 RepID=UPI002041B731|nr:hypothetical protein [Microbacterium hydrocarbonoxydans]MCM3778995.1 hypothetical protein [Microbacterium hydrocarbonoxydans]